MLNLLNCLKLLTAFKLIISLKHFADLKGQLLLPLSVYGAIWSGQDMTQHAIQTGGQRKSSTEAL